MPRAHAHSPGTTRNSSKEHKSHHMDPVRTQPTWPPHCGPQDLLKDQWAAGQPTPASLAWQMFAHVGYMDTQMWGLHDPEPSLGLLGLLALCLGEEYHGSARGFLSR